MNGKGCTVIALLPAPGSSLAYGRAHFPGGLGARTAPVPRTVPVAAPAGLAVEPPLWPVPAPRPACRT